MNITLTGADERTPIRDLCRLADMGAEIGLLYTHSPDGRHRYPSLEWIADAAKALDGRVAIHVCGGRARVRFTRGDLDRLLFTTADGPRCVRRVQVNGKHYPASLKAICRLYPAHTIITQHTNDDDISGVDADNHALLVDGSGGRGISPERWARPSTTKAVGFAGGLNADNLAVELPKIAAVAQGEWWIDLEGGLRDADDWFSVEKAMAVMEAWKRFAETDRSTPPGRLVAGPSDGYTTIKAHSLAVELLRENDRLRPDRGDLRTTAAELSALVERQVATIAGLQADVARLQALNAGLCDRVAAAAEVLGRVAARLPVCRCEAERVSGAGDYGTDPDGTY